MTTPRFSIALLPEVAQVGSCHADVAYGPETHSRPRPRRAVTLPSDHDPRRATGDQATAHSSRVRYCTRHSRPIGRGYGVPRGSLLNGPWSTAPSSDEDGLDRIYAP